MLHVTADIRTEQHVEMRVEKKLTTETQHTHGGMTGKQHPGMAFELFLSRVMQQVHNPAVHGSLRIVLQMLFGEPTLLQIVMCVQNRHQSRLPSQPTQGHACMSHNTGHLADARAKSRV